jgi:Cep192 domain 4/HYDIN/CFA65/VesB-like, Ig-like domain/Abnormal spindle-like microcephaly-assoc'd, ASPM-SPD-2-Hydin
VTVTWDETHDEATAKQIDAGSSDGRQQAFGRLFSYALALVCLCVALASLSGCGLVYNNLPLAINPSDVSFGTVPVGHSQQTTITLHNYGLQTISLNGINVGAPFVVASAEIPKQLPSGASAVVAVTFAPQSAQDYNSTIAVVTPAGQAQVAVSGSGAGPNASQPTPTGVLRANVSALDFGTQAVGSNTQQTLLLSSTGTAPVTLSQIATGSSAFMVIAPALPAVVQPGQVLSLAVDFMPSASGAVSSQLTVTSDAATTPTLTVSLTGSGATAAPASTGGLSFSPTAVNFGQVTVGADAFKTVTLVATRARPVTVSSIVAAGAGFSVLPQSLPLTLQPHQQLSLRVALDPVAAGGANGNLTIISNSDTNPTTQIPLQGEGVVPTVPSLAASESALSFGQQTVGSKSTQHLTVTSTGTAPAQITAGSVSGVAFSASYAGIPIGNLSSPILLQPGQSAIFDVSFAPVAQGNVQGSLLLSTDTGAPLQASLSGMGATAPTPSLSLSASSLNFGSVLQGNSAQLNLTLTSTGTAPVTVSGASIAGAGFSIASTGASGWPATLLPGQSIALQLAFAPEAPGPASGSLVLSSDSSGGSVSVSLSGAGTVAPLPGLSTSTTALSFGSVSVGSTSVQTLTLTSSGTAPVTITSLGVTGTQFSVSNPTLPVTLQPNQQLTLQVTFRPQTPASDAEQLAITSDAGSVAVALGGTGVPAAEPVISVSSNAIAFGQVVAGSTASRNLIVTNTGQAPLSISSLAVNGGAFQASPSATPVVLQPNQQLALSVTFAPAAPGNAAGSLALVSNGGSATVSLSGTGAAAPAPVLNTSVAMIQFGSVTVWSTGTASITLSNAGTSALTIESIVESGAAFTASPGGPLTLQAGQQTTVEVTFAPSAAGAAAGSVAITSNGGNATVALTGAGVTAVQHEADLTWSPPTTSTDPLVGYNVYRSSSGGAPQVLNTTLVSRTSFADTAVVSGATYAYFVRSVDAEGQESGDSNQISLTIP